LTQVSERLLVVPALVALLLGLAVGAASAGGSPSATVDGRIGVDGGGHAVVTGTYHCASGTLSLTAVLAEGQPVYAGGQAPIELPCNGSTLPWTATVTPTAGGFRPRDSGTVTLRLAGAQPSATAVEYVVLL
jgi:hypothetical protein